ncbi:hypothetical protein GH714_032182 [Hevea brasiliensis]|uniref:non-specific serine/threonine protein kinase n=1 Tax=Hevea brasiliensis TaxID=3981 RepID=A0A6A6LDI5_HEVBR|nr:hypothetical protein GH714_032182 [Hevea brasiliensis]
MGLCCSKDVSAVKNDGITPATHFKPPSSSPPTERPVETPSSTDCNPFAASPFQSPLPAGVPPSPSEAGTPGRKFRWPLPPPSPAKPIMAIMRRRGQTKPPKEVPIPEDGEGGEGERQLDRVLATRIIFRPSSSWGGRLGEGILVTLAGLWEREGELRGQPVAVKIISKAKMTTAISIEDVRREIKIMKALSGHKHMIKFHDAFEDANNVYMVMELCEGGELLDRILSRGGRYTEEDAKSIVVQILSVVAFCHLQGVVHRDLKPENFLFTTRDEDAPMKIIDFGLSDFIRPDQRLNDIVGSAYYVAPEVLHRSYSVEADMWSIGVITYILLCGSRPFWAQTESGIFRSVLRADPNFDDSPWPVVSAEAKAFVKRLLSKDHRKRMTAAQALTHPWLRDENRPVPLDILIYKSVKSYVRATPLKRAALKALSKAIPEDEFFYLKAQFSLLEPKDGFLSLNSFKAVLTRHFTDAMKESRVIDIFNVMEPLSYEKMGFEEFCAAAINTYQLEVLEDWEDIAHTAFEYFEEEGNRVISVQELALEMNLGPTAHSLVNDWIRSSDGKLSFLGYIKFLHGVTLRSCNTRQR